MSPAARTPTASLLKTEAHQYNRQHKTPNPMQSANETQQTLESIGYQFAYYAPSPEWHQRLFFIFDVGLLLLLCQLASLFVESFFFGSIVKTHQPGFLLLDFPKLTFEGIQDFFEIFLFVLYIIQALRVK